jgi:hypothetical protein
MGLVSDKKVPMSRSSDSTYAVTRSEISPKARNEGIGGRVVEIRANRQSREPSTTLLFKLVLEVVLGVAHEDRSVNTLA